MRTSMLSQTRWGPGATQQQQQQQQLVFEGFPQGFPPDSAAAETADAVSMGLHALCGLHPSLDSATQQQVGYCLFRVQMRSAAAGMMDGRLYYIYR